MASVSWSDAAQKDLDSLDSVVAKRVVEKVCWFAVNIESLMPEPLHSVFAGLYKLRIGDYRVIYALRNGRVFIEAVRHRSKAYR